MLNILYGESEDETTHMGHQFGASLRLERREREVGYPGAMTKDCCDLDVRSSTVRHTIRVHNEVYALRRPQ